GQALWHLNRTEEALTKLHQLRAELIGRPNTIVSAACSASIASALVMGGKWAEGRKYALEALVLAQRANSRYYEGAAQNILCMAERALCRWENSREAAEAAVAAYAEIGAELQAAFVRRSLAITQWKLGDLAGAEASIQATLGLLAAGRHETHLAYARLLGAVIRL